MTRNRNCYPSLLYIPTYASLCHAVLLVARLLTCVTLIAIVFSGIASFIAPLIILTLVKGAMKVLSSGIVFTAVNLLASTSSAEPIRRAKYGLPLVQDVRKSKRYRYQPNQYNADNQIETSGGLRSPRRPAGLRAGLGRYSLLNFETKPSMSYTSP